MVTPGFGISQAKSMFFSSAKVQAAVDAATRKNLSKFGAWVRQDAKRSIRKRKKVRKTGPPRNVTGKLKKFIFFTFDMSSRSVIIGPARFARAKRDNLVMLEYGGTRMSDKFGVKVQQRYPPRPFMRPAFAKNLPRGVTVWKDSM